MPPRWLAKWQRGDFSANNAPAQLPVVFQSFAPVGLFRNTGPGSSTVSASQAAAWDFSAITAPDSTFPFAKDLRWVTVRETQSRILRRKYSGSLCWLPLPTVGLPCEGKIFGLPFSVIFLPTLRGGQKIFSLFCRHYGGLSREREEKKKIRMVSLGQAAKLFRFYSP